MLVVLFVKVKRTVLEPGNGKEAWGEVQECQRQVSRVLFPNRAVQRHTYILPAVMCGKQGKLI